MYGVIRKSVRFYFSVFIVKGIFGVRGEEKGGKKSNLAPPPLPSCGEYNTNTAGVKRRTPNAQHI